jgi:hypothetical protein
LAAGQSLPGALEVWRERTERGSGERLREVGPHEVERDRGRQAHAGHLQRERIPLPRPAKRLRAAVAGQGRKAGGEGFQLALDAPATDLDSFVPEQALDRRRVDLPWGPRNEPEHLPVAQHCLGNATATRHGSRAYRRTTWRRATPHVAGKV